MKIRGLIAGLALAGLIAGCTAPPAPASRTETLELSAVVRAVDMKSREIELETGDGRPLTLLAGPEVRNLAQLEPGDRVRAYYQESVAVRMAEADEAGGDTLVTIGRAEEGETPGGFAVSTVQAVVTFISYDPETGIATYTMPDGTIRSTVVKPELRDFAAALKPGDRVNLTYTRALAITVSEQAE